MSDDHRPEPGEQCAPRWLKEYLDAPPGVRTAEALYEYARDMQSSAEQVVPLEEYEESDDWCNLHRLPFLYCCHLHHP